VLPPSLAQLARKAERVCGVRMNGVCVCCVCVCARARVSCCRHQPQPSPAVAGAGKPELVLLHKVFEAEVIQLHSVRDAAPIVCPDERGASKEKAIHAAGRGCRASTWRAHGEQCRRAFLPPWPGIALGSSASRVGCSHGAPPSGWRMLARFKTGPWAEHAQSLTVAGDHEPSVR
jgi:hypothetical protein